MSAAGLILKQPSGWFAAGREVAQALTLLSDGAFKLYIHLCLEAERHTGRAAIDLAALTRILRQDRESVEAGLRELQLHKVCERRSGRNLRSVLAVSEAGQRSDGRCGSRLHPASARGFFESLHACALYSPRPTKSWR